MAFEARSNADVARLIDEFPLAWLVSLSDARFLSTPLPLLADVDATTGEITTLIGHFALSNAHVKALRMAPRALILFNGPHGYMSPEGVSKPKWAPTWNYAVAQFEVDIELKPEENAQAIERLVRRMERDRAQPWTPAQMGERYAQLASRIIAFRAHVRSSTSRFKLGQNETPTVFGELVSRLDDPLLVSWMREFNAERIEPT